MNIISHQQSRLVSILVMALFTSACTTVSSTSSLNRASQETNQILIDVPANWQSNAVNNQKAIETVSWIDQVGDLKLKKLIAEAQENNPNLRMSALNIEKSRAMVLQAKAQLAPELNLVVGGSREATIEASPKSDLNLGLRAQWEVDVWGRLKSSERAATASLIATEYDYLYARNSLAANVAQAYFFAIEAHQQLEISKQSVDSLKETNRIVYVQFENGVASKEDLALAKSDLANAQAIYIENQGAKRSAMRALELLLGRYPRANVDFAAHLPTSPNIAGIGVPSAILENRPDLVAQERRIAAAFDSLDAAKTARLPQVSLFGELGGSSNALSNILDSSNIAWRLFNNIVAPLIDSGRIKANINVATVEQKTAVTKYVQSALIAFNEVETALDQSLVLNQQGQALLIALSEAEEAFRVINLQLKQGEVSLLDVLTIQQRVFSTKKNYLSVKRANLNQFVDLSLALGII